MRLIDPQNVLEAIRPMVPSEAAGKLPVVLFPLACPRRGCKGYLNYRGVHEGLKIFDCQTCHTPFIEAPALFDLTDQDAEAVQPVLRVPPPPKKPRESNKADKDANTAEATA